MILSKYFIDHRYHRWIPWRNRRRFSGNIDVVKKVRYDSAFTFIYSKRTGTPAAKMENQDSRRVVKDRFDRLLSEVQKISKEESKKVEGQVLPVLVEGINEHDPELLTGRLTNNLLVHFKGEKQLIGTITDVYLKENSEASITWEKNWKNRKDKERGTINTDDAAVCKDERIL